MNSLTPDYYGGNMDCVETRLGNEVLFPVLVPGVHFFTGDAHASQGDGERTGGDLEVPAPVVVTFDLVSGSKINWPRIVSEELIMVADYGFDRMRAYHFLGQIGQMRLGNMVDPKDTMVAKCPRRYL